MNVRQYLIFSKLLCGAFLVMAAVALWPATADEKPAKTDVWEVARGGQLYDKWYGVLGREAPKVTHPS